MGKTIVQKTVEYVQARLAKEGSGHDWHHTRRIWEMAKRIQQIEGGNLELIELAALLHCAAERDFKKGPDEKTRSLALEGILDVLEVPEEYHEQIVMIAQWCRFKADDTPRPTTLEGMIVQDADWLDALGAVGLARGFTAGGYIGRPIHDPAILPLERMNKETYQKRKKEGTSYNYFVEKSLQLPRFMNTNTGKMIAERRVTYVKNFLDELQLEWDCGDADEVLRVMPIPLVFPTDQGQPT